MFLAVRPLSSAVRVLRNGSAKLLSNLNADKKWRSAQGRHSWQGVWQRPSASAFGQVTQVLHEATVLMVKALSGNLIDPIL